MAELELEAFESTETIAAVSDEHDGLEIENKRLRAELEKSYEGKGLIAQMAERGAFGLFLRAKRAETRARHLEVEARRWAQEARTQRHTVHQVYQLVTGATGEPGDWHGAEPVRALVAERDVMRRRLERICADYCQWYDRGLGGLDGSGIAYHLVGHARMGLAGKVEGEMP